MNDLQVIETLLKDNRIERVLQTAEDEFTDCIARNCSSVGVMSSIEARKRHDNVIVPQGDLLTATMGLQPDLCVIVEKPGMAEDDFIKNIHTASQHCDALFVKKEYHAGMLEKAGLEHAWIAADMNLKDGCTLLLKRQGRSGVMLLKTYYGQKEEKPLLELGRKIETWDTSPMNIVTIMNYPDDEKCNLMCMIWMQQVLKHAPDSNILVLTERGLPPSVRAYFNRFDNVAVSQGNSRKVGIFDHFFIAFKLYNLCHITAPFIYLDADMFVFSDLSYLWRRRHLKPWIAVEHQDFPNAPANPIHVNAGMQIVSEPGFYDFDLIVMCFEQLGSRFRFAGEDQSLLIDYFQATGYDFHHPEIDCSWNAFSLHTNVTKDESGEWRAHTHGLPVNYPVHINHYWNGPSRPWNLGCPFFAEKAEELRRSGALNASPGISLSGTTASQIEHNTEDQQDLRVCVVGGSPDTIKTPGEHPFFPLENTRIIAVENPDEADVIFGHLDPGDPCRGYKRILYLQNELFRNNEPRFLFHSSYPACEIFYANNALCLTPHPLYERSLNRMSRVYSVPYLFDCIDHEIIQDHDFIEECRQQPRTVDYWCATDPHALRIPDRDMLGKFTMSGPGPTREELLAMESTERLKRVRELLRDMARARFFLYAPRRDGKYPLLFYHAMMMGVIPIVTHAFDFPFSDSFDWSTFCSVCPDSQALNEILALPEDRLRTMKASALQFSEEFCRPASCNERILRDYVKPLICEAGQ